MSTAAPGTDLELSAVPDEVQAAHDYLPATLAGNAAGAAVVALLFWGSGPQGRLGLWLACFSAVWAARLALGLRFRRSVRHTLAQWRSWQRRAHLATLASGANWGLAGGLFYTDAMGITQTGLILVVYTFCVAAMPILATQPRIYAAYLALAAAPLIVRIAGVGDRYSLQLAGLLALIVVLTALLGGSYRQAMARVIALKLQLSELLVQLRHEKQAAEDARRVAETANRAKTQFFAAASHDLRQPLHAMGLFAQALRERTRDSEVAPLVNSINESVDALESLFSELLDITRIDSAMIEVKPCDFRVGDMLQRLRLHFEPSAFEKGLALRLRGASRIVFADPLLVERIVRNLVANAIRYTEDGTVLVGCRQRGKKVSLQVWDSGCGIAPEEQSRVFDEFYQVRGSASAAPGQRKGLGLGLAIVKRLAEAMGAPLSLRSWPGQGSVFTLELPAGEAHAQAHVASANAALQSLRLEGRRFIIVEDEPAVRAGLEALLLGWGATLRIFDSVSACTAWASGCAADEPAPELLIVDYRLEDGRDGLEALGALRSRFGAATPAIMISGSTMSGVEAQAQEHDFHLLIKPVLPNKLRAMITFKLQGPPAQLGTNDRRT
ncbi:MAG: hybrid sensor histidine kinase/response regulator [Burkholderiaceae bacterium]